MVNILSIFNKPNPIVKPEPVVYNPAKPRLQLAIDTKISRIWKGIVWHHSLSDDNIVKSDFESLKRYHLSFRIDYNAVAGPVAEKDKVPSIQYVKYTNGQWYKKTEYDNWQAGYKAKQANKTDKRKFEPAWMDIAYHGVIEFVNNQVIFHYGRPLNEVGAHAGYDFYNKNYLGFCACGNYDVNPVPKEIFQVALMTTRSFMDAFKIDAGEVIGHREIYDRLKLPRQKQCPGNRWSMGEFRSGI